MRTGRASALTDTGRRRPQNEDTFVCDPPLFAVADGVGGAQAGEIASRLAAAALEERRPDAQGEATLAELLREANDRIYRRALDDPSAAGMGTVVTALLVDEAAGTIAIGHVGDSRAYRSREGELEQLTPDHSLVGELVRAGRLSAEEAEQHPHRSVITRAVGTEPIVEVETLTVTAAPGDLYLICSDGLTDIVRDEQIAELLAAAENDPDSGCGGTRRCCQPGGRDRQHHGRALRDPRWRARAATLTRGRPRRRHEGARTRDPAGRAGCSAGAGAAPRRGLRRPLARPCRDPVHPRRRRARHLVEPHAVSARNKELLNLGFAALVASAAFASVSIVGTGLVSARWLGYVGVIFGLYLVAHVVARFTVPYADPTLLPLVGLLTALGLTVIYRLGPDDARRQAVWVAIGIGVLAATLIWLRFDYRVLERYKYLFGISAVVLLLLPSVPGLGHRVNGVKLWVKIGPMQFQPGELAKIFLIVFLAGYLRDKREALAQGRLKDLGPLLAIWGAAMLVLVQTSDLGSALLNFGIFLAMVYAATGRALYVGVGIALFVAGSAALYNALDRVQQRVTVWLHPWTDDKVYCSINGKLEFRQNCDSYQLVKSLYSIANGGYGGTGLGKGTFKTVDGTQLIPYLNTDFVYSAVAQELGLIGAAAVLLLFMVLVARGMRIALIAQDGFSKLLATGLTFGLALQTFIIVGGVLRVVPLTGITLPFVSYGGSSILSNFVMLGLLLLVSNRAAATAVHR